MAPSSPVDLQFGDDGLLHVIAQDAETDEVLMLGFASSEALAKTQNTGLAHYHSRSDDRLRRGGEADGYDQRVEEIRVDCDGDALVYRVDQDGDACCTGHHSCFHRTIDGREVGAPIPGPTGSHE